MTPAQNLEYEILNTEAKLHGLRLELALAMGDRPTAQKHMTAMYAAFEARGDFIRMTADANNECFFTAAGEADRLALQGAAG